MNKIRIIDLLNKIANGEEVPKKIKLNEVIFEYRGDDYLYKDEDKKEYWLFSSGYTDKYAWLEIFLKAEVEVLEEPKGIPKKLYHCCMETDNKETKFLIKNMSDLVDRYNELLDYLESKGND